MCHKDSIGGLRERGDYLGGHDDEANVLHGHQHHIISDDDLARVRRQQIGVHQPHVPNGQSELESLRSQTGKRVGLAAALLAQQASCVCSADTARESSVQSSSASRVLITGHAVHAGCKRRGGCTSCTGSCSEARKRSLTCTRARLSAWNMVDRPNSSMIVYADRLHPHSNPPFTSQNSAFSWSNRRSRCRERCKG